MTSTPYHNPDAGYEECSRVKASCKDSFKKADLQCCAPGRLIDFYPAMTDAADGFVQLTAAEPHCILAYLEDGSSALSNISSDS